MAALGVFAHGPSSAAVWGLGASWPAYFQFVFDNVGCLLESIYLLNGSL